MAHAGDVADAEGSETATTLVLGVDGTRLGWVGVTWDRRDAVALFDVTLAGLCEQAGTPTVVAVDMPIGLETSDRRSCDDLVRPLLGPRRSSLFAAPARGALDHETYADANAWSKLTTGRGLSKQAWMLAPKIREVRALAATRSVPLYETFPELSFAAMAGAPLSHPKRTWTGMATRLSLLAEVGLALPAEVGPAGSVAADDLIDAAALAWSAMRIVDGTAECRPTPARSGSPSSPDAAPTIWW